jgi:3-dehydro-L-gulonate 2-dehydrogenase
VGFTEEKADRLATIFADNTRDGVASHGINRFPRFIGQVRERIIDIDATATCICSAGAWEQWDAHHGPGPLQAEQAIRRAMDISGTYGIGVVALRNATHWMRGGTYGRIAAEEGYAAICWTNTTANMSPWGTTVHAIGNNPLVMAVPGEPYPVVLDMAMSQYSYGKLQVLAAEEKTLPYPGGFAADGVLSSDPAPILETRQILPAGMWKGSALSVLLDLMAGIFSGGAFTASIPEREDTCAQVFLAIGKAPFANGWRTTVHEAIERMECLCAQKGEQFTYPGKSASGRKVAAEREGIEVSDAMLERLATLTH